MATKLTASILLSKEECEQLMALCEDSEECEDLHFKFYRAARLLRKKEKSTETETEETAEPADHKPKGVRGRRKKAAASAE